MASMDVDRYPDLVLPNEILGAIFVELAPPALVHVAAASSRFKAVAERILYSSINIQDLVSSHSPTPWRTLRWCETISQRLQLLDLVRRVHIRWQTDATPPAPHHFITLCERLGEVLQSLTFLESLELFLGPANLIDPRHREPIHAIERVIGKCQLPHLRTCSLGADYTKGAQPYTPILSQFLISHPSLQQLKIPDLNSRLDILDSSLPNLTAFRGSADAAASLLPGRPVQQLALFGDDSSVNRENLPRIACTSIPLRHLDLSAMSARPMLLKNIALYLPHLHTFRVKLALRHTLHYAFTGIRLLTGLSTVLSSFGELVFLDLSPTDVNGVGRADSREELALCQEWRRGCPTLRRIIFPSQTEFVLGSDLTWSIVSR
ncbi:hypothetical protein CC1G_05764 [Coprinopsis cinerea okayama7|uniref:F-box domain-containing protein n=1 Tax=Coprinopsis cinerea (strain Okayama-7 / 130 / ATCC MYA-4618 / FGSC 9003) TaxID=240176 RepID=A8NA37_COPC7|nr:hypothetical protein CC1G_05764 [Coprinopsis cinerea okayama7\|eukprot:XP_001831693.2 hypothetical protein CC1G_05764 [Coprinopsis cinerea okayama7\